MTLSLVASWIFLLFQFAVQYTAQGREVPKLNWRYGDKKDVYGITKQRVDDYFWIYAKQSNDVAQATNQKRDLDDISWIYGKKAQEISVNKYNGRGHAHYRHYHIKPSHHIFFTLEDLKIGKTMPLYFPRMPDPSKTPRLLPREEAESIPFSSSQLSRLLDYFSFPKRSPQAKAMAYTLQTCELHPIKGEVKYCAASLEAILNGVRQILGPDTKSQTLTTTYLSMHNTGDPLQNYTIQEAPKQVAASRMVACHPMPYPYAVFYCHSQPWSENKLFQITLGGPNGERVEAVAVCHMDTSQWNHDHASFRVLNIEPGSSPVCHFFPVDSIIWVPVQSSGV
ncbi:hypothetical protein CDL15_Pgr010472 [Punica granatum]|uniref:BURP domain-containing protein n=1 Tax=Punica granatum TaxID=22663 RepID=A0A218XX13_PUNGR|nr:hypothetical protein CDL15_Pgr010472 [Punica granatum]